MKLCASALALAGSAGAAFGAGVILANAQITGVPIGNDEYSYTVTLNNTAASTASIGMFWFGWEAGQADFLTSSPSNIVTPPEWVGTVDGGGDEDGYSIQFVTFTSPLQPGSSVTFTFQSQDSTNVMAGPATGYPEYLTLTSQVYSGHAATGVQQVFITQLVPAPQAGALPTLIPQLAGSSFTLSWAAGTNIVLQQASSLSPLSWANVEGTLGAGTFTVTNIAAQPLRYYRLATQ